MKTPNCFYRCGRKQDSEGIGCEIYPRGIPEEIRYGAECLHQTEFIRVGLPPRPRNFCTSCKHRFMKDDKTCAAFPNGIPVDILRGKTGHRTSRPSDQGIVYERRDDPGAHILLPPPELPEPDDL